MLIRREVLERIREGEVTLVFRRWRRPTVRSGGTLKTSVGVLAIDLVEGISETQVTEPDARAAGYAGLEDLLADLRGRRGDLHRISVRYAGEDPRIALREKDELDPQELAEIARRLERMDTSSRTGSWTLRALETIRDHPQVLAEKLAAMNGLEKAPFKRNVRKLKELGLTISHSPGYTLSPRGEVVLRHLLTGRSGRANRGASADGLGQDSQARAARTLPPRGLSEDGPMITAQEALERLQQGNRRFTSGESRRQVVTSQARLMELAKGQEPFAVVLGCSDSRVPAEIVFDQDLGDLFVIRVAGNIVAPSQVGSVEFAAEQFGTRLVVVLGHSMCGAVQATLDELANPSEAGSPSVRSITGRIRPAVQELVEAGASSDPSDLLRHAVRANVRASAGHLRRGSEVLERLIRQDGLMVVGAEYSLDTGVVEFFDGLP